MDLKRLLNLIPQYIGIICNNKVFKYFLCTKFVQLAKYTFNVIIGQVNFKNRLKSSKNIINMHVGDGIINFMNFIRPKPIFQFLCVLLQVLNQSLWSTLLSPIKMQEGEINSKSTFSNCESKTLPRDAQTKLSSSAVV